MRGSRARVPGLCENAYVSFCYTQGVEIVSISLPHTHGYLIGLVRHLNKFPRVHNLWGHCGDRLFIS